MASGSIKKIPGEISGQGISANGSISFAVGQRLLVAGCYASTIGFCLFSYNNQYYFISNTGEYSASLSNGTLTISSRATGFTRVIAIEI